MFSPWFDNGGIFAELEALRRQMESLYDRSDERGSSHTGGLQLREEDDRYVLTLDVPGLAPDDLELTSTGNQLTVAAERDAKPPAGARAHHRERRSWRFSRTINLPDDVDVDAIGADLRDGVLTLTLPHRPEAQPRRIDVRTA